MSSRFFWNSQQSNVFQNDRASAFGNGSQNPSQGTGNSQPVFSQGFTGFNQGFQPNSGSNSFGQSNFGQTQANFNQSASFGSGSQSRMDSGGSAFGVAPQSAFFGQGPSDSRKRPNSQFAGAFVDNNKPPSAFSLVPSGNAQPFLQQAPTNIQPQQSQRKDRKKESNEEKKRERKREQRQKRSTSKSPANRAPQLPQFPPGQYTNRRRPQANDMAILKPLPKPLTIVNYRRDDWDVSNQEKMAAIEQQYLSKQISLQSAYEQMARMRDTERREMERRGLVDSTETRKNLTDAIQFVGSCLEMCPVFERVRRAHENNALSFEKNSEGRVVKELAVKAFSRPAAGQPPPLPSDVRPPAVLVSTLQYLVTNVVPNLPASHAFLWDRTRSIRQDFTYQNYQGKEALSCFEVIARIHCVSLHRMAKAVAQAGAEWSQQQELEQFNKCLQSLSEFYQSQPLASSNEPEMRAYQLLSHFFDDEMAASIDRLPPQISRHPLVCLALELRSTAAVSVTKFFQRLRMPDVPATFRAVTEIHFNALRMRAIRHLLESMHKRMNMYSMNRFAELLGFETVQEARSFCEYYDLLVDVSAEAGEEVDIKSWEESNVKDKQAMGQSFDSSLDAQIEGLDVLKPLSEGAPIPASIVAASPPVAGVRQQTSSNQFSRFNPATPAFKPASSVAFSQSQQLQAQQPQQQPPTVQPSNSNGGATTGIKTVEQLKRSDNVSKAEEESQRQRLDQHLLKEREELRQKQLEAQREQERQAQLLEQQRQAERQAQLQREREQQQREQLQLQRQQQKKEEESIQRERMQRVALRSKFVENAKQAIFSHLLNDVCNKDCDRIISSVAMGNKLILSHALKRIKTAAGRALKRQQEQQLRDQELKSFRMFRGRKRIVSNRFINEPDDSLEEESNSNPQPVIQVNGSEAQPSNAVPKRRFDFTPLLSLLKKAASCGLNRIRFATDWSSPRGQWLLEVFDLESSVVISPGVILEPVRNPESREVDLVILDKRFEDADLAPQTISVTTDAASTRSLSALRDDISKELQRYLSWHEASLLSHRSLNIKRRRLTSSTCNKSSDRPTESPDSSEVHGWPRASRAIVPSSSQRLRALIAETNRLANES